MHILLNISYTYYKLANRINDLYEEYLAHIKLCSGIYKLAAEPRCYEKLRQALVENHRKTITRLNRTITIYESVKEIRKNLCALANLCDQLLKKDQLVYATVLVECVVYEQKQQTVADRLGVSIRTVEHILTKLDSYSRARSKIEQLRASEAVKQARRLIKLSKPPEYAPPKHMAAIIDSCHDNSASFICPADVLTLYDAVSRSDCSKAETAGLKAVIKKTDGYITKYSPTIRELLDWIKEITTHYFVFDRIISEAAALDKSFADFVKAECSAGAMSSELNVFKSFIEADAGGYRRSAAVCGTTIYRLKTAIPQYEKLFVSFRKSP